MGNALQYFLHTVLPWRWWWVGLGSPAERAEVAAYRQRAFRAALRGDVAALRELAALSSGGGGGGSTLKLPTLRHMRKGGEEGGATLLHVAMERSEGARCVPYLISAGCELTPGNRSGETALHAAAMHDNAEGLLAALNHQGSGEVDLEAADLWGRTPLLKAMVYRSRRVLALLLDEKRLRVNVDAQDCDGLSVLHLAARYDHVDLIAQLAARGARLDLLMRSPRGSAGGGRSPLSVAITARNPEAVRQLLVSGASTCVYGGGGGGGRGRGGGLGQSSTSLVLTAVGELVRRVESSSGRGRAEGEGGDGGEGGGGGERVFFARAERVLHEMLAAHGVPLHADEPDVFLRVLSAQDLTRFLPLLHKLHLCSDCPYGHAFASTSISSSSSSYSAAAELRSPVSLFDLARRAARRALMGGGRNVVWAVERLDLQARVPPAVRGLLLLQDCDRKECPLLAVNLALA